MSWSDLRSPASIRQMVVCEQSRISASCSCDSPDAARMIVITAPMSARASASRSGGESHTHPGTQLSRARPARGGTGASRTARRHGPHRPSGLYRLSRVARQAAQSRGTGAGWPFSLVIASCLPGAQQAPRC
jgi:hypothetical protein